MSLGDSDISWWKYLLNWLYAKNTRKLVLYIRTAQGNDTSAAEKLRQINNWKERFLKKANAKHDVAQQIKKQIIVVLNSKIFDFENISTKTTTKDSVQV